MKFNHYLLSLLKKDLQKNTIKSPPLLVLDDNHKFSDDQGRICDIRVYGYRSSPDSIYISLLDIEREFEYDQLCKCVLWGDMGLEAVKDILSFNAAIKDPTDKLNKTMKLRLHITMKLITNSHNPTMVKYNQWLKEAFFVTQMGTEEQRIELASKILKSNINDVQDILKLSNSPVIVGYIVAFSRLIINGQVNPDLDSKLKKITQMLFDLYGSSFELYKLVLVKISTLA